MFFLKKDFCSKLFFQKKIFCNLAENQYYMERLFEISKRLVNNVETKFYRYLYKEIDWTDSLIMLRGARGVGKTTMMYQRCQLTEGKGLYVSLDQLWFNDHTIIELVDYHYKHGGTHLFLDEVHRYPRNNWEQELKNIHDSYPDYKVVFTASYLLQLNSKVADLSRRVAIYELRGLSFREYLNFSSLLESEPYSMEDILKNHTEIASSISSRVRIIGEFDNYIKKGYYPFFMSTSSFTYVQRVERIVQTVIDIDIPSVANIEYETQLKLKKLIVILAEQVPFVPNMSKLSRDVGVTRNQLLKLFQLLCEGAILRSLNEASTQPKNAAKPDKILFDNPSVMQALGASHHIGTMRESFVASMLSSTGKVYSAPAGDFLLDRKYLFEVGGKGKGFSQISDIPDSYVIADNIEVGFGNKIPLWLLGFLY